MLVKNFLMHIHRHVLLQDATSNYKYNFNIFNPFHIRVSPEFENCPTTVSSHLRSGPQAAYAAEGCQPVLPGPTQGFLGLQTISDPHPSVIISIALVIGPFRMIRTWISRPCPSGQGASPVGC